MTGSQLVRLSTFSSFRLSRWRNVCLSMNVLGYVISTRSSAGLSLNMSSGNWISWPLGVTHVSIWISFSFLFPSVGLLVAGMAMSLFRLLYRRIAVSGPASLGWLGS